MTISDHMGQAHPSHSKKMSKSLRHRTYFHQGEQFHLGPLLQDFPPNFSDQLSMLRIA